MDTVKYLSDSIVKILTQGLHEFGYSDVTAARVRDLSDKLLDGRIVMKRGEKVDGILSIFIADHLRNAGFYAEGRGLSEVETFKGRVL